MVGNTKQRGQRKVVQISVFVLPKEKRLIIERAKAENRTISNYCKLKILEENANSKN